MLVLDLDYKLTSKKDAKKDAVFLTSLQMVEQRQACSQDAAPKLY